MGVEFTECRWHVEAYITWVWHGSTAPLWPGICSATGGIAACADVWGMFHDRWTTNESRYSSRIHIFHQNQVFLLTIYYQPQSLSVIIDMGCKKCHIYENNTYYLPIFSCLLHTFSRGLWFTVTAENSKLHEDPVSETTQVEEKKSHLQLVMINHVTEVVTKKPWYPHGNLLSSYWSAVWLD